LPNGRPSCSLISAVKTFLLHGNPRSREKIFGYVEKTVMPQLRSVFTLMHQAHNQMEDMYDRAQVLTGGKLVVVVFAMAVAI